MSMRFAVLGCCAIVGCANGNSVGDESSTGSEKPSGGSPKVGDAGSIIDAGTEDAACATALEQPWSGSGINASYVVQDSVTIINVDRYWVFDYTSGAWSAHGHLEDLWAAAPTIDGFLPWQGVGVNAAYLYGTTQTIISGDRMWTVDASTGVWGATTHLETAWAAAPSNGGFKPWDPPGVLSAYVYQTGITVISADRYWVLDVPSSTWTSGALETVWSGAPMVDSKQPWQGTGVSASWIYGGLQTILSADRYWISNVTSGAWTDTGHLETVWAASPSVDDCK